MMLHLRILAACALSTFVIGVVPMAASAQTADELRAQAQALLERIAQLQAQLGASANAGASAIAGTSVSVDSSACPLIGRSLRHGASGDDVMRLQQFLARDTSVYPEAMITGYYGALTEAAVRRWQVKYNIVSSGTPDTTGYGVVGPRTAAAIALVCSTMSISGGGTGIPAASGAQVGGYIQVTPISGVAPLAVRVVATVNTVNSCQGSVYMLDYGDGTVPSQIVVPAGNCQQMVQNLGHTYVYGGSYIVTLSAGGHRTSANVVVTGASAPGSGGTPAALDSVSGSPTSGEAPLSVAFTGTINGAQSCTGGTYTLLFGDDQSVPLPFDSSSCAPRSFSVSHQYSESGTYDARLLRGGSSGVAVGSAVRITVSAKSSGFGPMTITPNLNSNALAVRAEFMGGCATYTLNWGDGTSVQSGSCGTGQMTVDHTYALAGSYTITLTRGSQVDTAAISIQ